MKRQTSPAKVVALVVATLLLLVVWESLLSALLPSAHGAARTEYMPCAGNDTELDCVWDQRHGGKGDGFSWSFYVDGQGHVYRLPHHLAHYLIYGGEQ